MQIYYRANLFKDHESHQYSLNQYMEPYRQKLSAQHIQIKKINFFK
jgi:hypothetical protein